MSRDVPKREYLMLKNSPSLNWEMAPFLPEPAIKKNAQLKKEKVKLKLLLFFTY